MSFLHIHEDNMQAAHDSDVYSLKEYIVLSCRIQRFYLYKLVMTQESQVQKKPLNSEDI